MLEQFVYPCFLWWLEYLAWISLILGIMTMATCLNGYACKPFLLVNLAFGFWTKFYENIHLSFPFGLAGGHCHRIMFFFCLSTNCFICSTQGIGWVLNPYSYMKYSCYKGVSSFKYSSLSQWIIKSDSLVLAINSCKCKNRQTQDDGVVFSLLIHNSEQIHNIWWKFWMYNI